MKVSLTRLDSPALTVISCVANTGYCLGQFSEARNIGVRSMETSGRTEVSTVIKFKNAEYHKVF